jgi:hypothetical protein
VDTTATTPAPATGGRQVGELLAGRYRLGVFKGGDDIADVWHALDQSSEKVVTLEILRDRENEPARQRFLAEAQRMAAIERPSVMRVAAIHNEANGTFIVFEHLIPLPVVLTGLTAVAKDGFASSRAPDAGDKTGVAPAAPAPAAPTAPTASASAAPGAPVAPEAPPPVAPTTLAAVIGPKRSAFTPEPASEVALASAIDRLSEIDDAPAPPPAAAITPSPGTPRADWGARLAEEMRQIVRDVGMDTFTTDARSFVADARERVSRRFDMSVATSLFARATSFVAGAGSLVARAASLVTQVTARTRGMAIRPRQPRVAPMPTARPAASAATRVTAAAATGVVVRVGGAALSSLAAIPMRLTASVAQRVARARGNRVVLAGATVALLLVVIVVSPLRDMLTTALQSVPAPSATATSSAALAPAPFAVPPLSEYGATFDSQGAYPTTTPNGAVEWVVALRNTGSAGWYRGIEGAQAALALPDGTGVAVQSTSYVAPGQVGWFVVRFRARAEVGTYTVQLRPRIDGRGPLPDLGIYAVVTVQKNP